MSNNKVVSYTPLDFDTLMTQFESFIKTNPEFANYDFKGGGLKAISRLLAYNSTMQAFQNQQMFNELHLSTAENRSSAAELTSMISYVPGSKTGSTITVNVVVTPANPDTAKSQIILNKEVVFTGNKDGVSYTFSPTQEYTAVFDTTSEKYTFNDVELKQGVWTTDVFEVQGSSIESYEITNSDIDISTLAVTVQASSTDNQREVYTRFFTAHQLGVTEQIFYLQLNRQGYYELYFGDDQISKKLPDGSIVIAQYTTTSGELGDGISVLTPGGSIGGYSDITIGLVDDKSRGGSEYESLESIKRYAPQKNASVGNAVNYSDYEVILKENFADVDDVKVWGGEDNNPKKYGYVIISVKPKSDETLTTSQKTSMIEFLSTYNVGSIDPIMVDPEYFYINVTSTVQFDYKSSSLNVNTLTSKIVDFAREYSSNVLEKFGSRIIKSRMLRLVDNVDTNIIGNHTQLQYEKRIIPSINTIGSYNISFNHEIDESGVYIEGYTLFHNVIGVPEFYMKDDGNGALISYRKDPDGTVNVLTSSAGTVDYDSGTINITNFNPTELGDEGMVIMADNKYTDSDVIPQRGEILKINDINIDVTLGA